MWWWWLCHATTTAAERNCRPCKRFRRLDDNCCHQPPKLGDDHDTPSMWGGPRSARSDPCRAACWISGYLLTPTTEIFCSPGASIATAVDGTAAASVTPTVAGRATQTIAPSAATIGNHHSHGPT
jgi:hypothetical protein